MPDEFILLRDSGNYRCKGFLTAKLTVEPMQKKRLTTASLSCFIT
jgi:hypothetical protein